MQRMAHHSAVRAAMMELAQRFPPDMAWEIPYDTTVFVNATIEKVVTMRWTRKFGQEVKLGLLLRRTDLNDGQAEAVFGGFQGEGCS